MKKTQITLFLAVLAFLLCACGGEEPEPEQTPTPVEYSGQLRISEVMIKNRAAALAPDFPDWAELENCSDSPVKLSGWTLTDAADKEGIQLSGEAVPPGAFAVFPLTGEGFALSEGETLILRSPDGREQDRLLCRDTRADFSLQRNADGSFSETPWISPGLRNGTAGYEDYASLQWRTDSLCIWEVMVSNQAHPLPGEGCLCDWVELKNRSDHSLLLEGWSLSDRAEEPRRWFFPARSLEPGELMLIGCDGDREADSQNTGFSLNAVSEQLYLFDPEGRLVDWVSLHEIPVEGSLGRMQERGGFFYFTEPSPARENTGGLRRVSAAPSADRDDGIYDGVEAVELALSAEGEIRYTLDGSLPSPASPLYTEPLQLTETVVVRAVSMETDAAPSRPASFHFILNENHSLPVVSLAVDDPEQFQDMYNNKLKDRELPANAAYFRPEEVFRQDCSLRMQGWTSLDQPKKSFRLGFSGRTGGMLQADVFGGDVTEFASLSLRVGQDDPSCIIRNELCQDAARDAGTSLLLQDSQYCVVYVNGSYYGIYCLKEDFSEQYYASHFAVSRDSVEQMRAPAWEDTSFYQQVVRYVFENDLRDPAAYETLCGMIDMEGLIDWYLIEGWSANGDTAGNLRLFHSNEGDGRWRFALYDLDFTFLVRDDLFGNLLDGNGHGSQFPRIFLALYQNESFRDQLLRRYGELIEGPLSNERTAERIEEYRTLLEPEIRRDRQRWRRSAESWALHLDGLERLFVQGDWCKASVRYLCNRMQLDYAACCAYFPQYYSRK